MSYANLTCKDCGQKFEKSYHLVLHRKKEHPHLLKKMGGAKVVSESPFEKIHRLKRELAQAIKDLDTERNQAQNRILEIDNLVAKSKEWV